MIVVENVSKQYERGNQRVRALDGVTVCAASGEFLAVVGPSGSGKSTLLHIIGGIDRPSSGDVRVAGYRLNDLSERRLTLFRRTQVGIIFQFFNLFPTLSAVENVMVPMLLDGVPVRKARSKSEQLLDKVGLGGRRGHLPEELSGGEVQRVAVARALALDPPIILADEPTGNLDSGNSKILMDLLRGLVRSGARTLVMVTHDRSLTSEADRVLELIDGCIAGNPGTG